METTEVIEVWYNSPEFISVAVGAILLVLEWIARYVPTKKPIKLILYFVIWLLQKSVEAVPEKIKEDNQPEAAEEPKKKKWYQFRRKE